MYIVGYFFFKKLMVFGIIFIKHCVKYLIEFDTISSKKNKQIRYIIYQFEKPVTRYNRSLKTERKWYVLIISSGHNLRTRVFGEKRYCFKLDGDDANQIGSDASSSDKLPSSLTRQTHELTSLGHFKTKL